MPRLGVVSPTVTRLMELTSDTEVMSVGKFITNMVNKTITSTEAAPVTLMIISPGPVAADRTRVAVTRTQYLFRFSCPHSAIPVAARE